MVDGFGCGRRLKRGDFGLCLKASVWNSPEEPTQPGVFRQVSGAYADCGTSNDAWLYTCAKCKEQALEFAISKGLIW